MKVGEFFVDMGINASPGATTLKDFLGSMGKMRMSTLATIGALGTIGTYILGVTDSASNAAVSFQKFSNQTGLSAQELQRWQIVAKQANVSADTVAGSVKNLQSRLATVRLTGQGIKPFQILGISPLGNAFEIMTKLRERMGQVSPDVFSNLIQEMGLDPSMVNVLKLSDKEFANFVDTARGMTPEVENNVLKMTEAFNQLWLKIKDINYEIANMASGPITSILGAIVKELGDKKYSTTERVFQAGTKTFDQLFGTNMTPFLKQVNSGWNRQQETKRLYNIRVAAAVNENDVPAFKDFVRDLEKTLNETEAQMPPGESLRPGVGLTGYRLNN
jgi:hypothetical protein